MKRSVYLISIVGILIIYAPTPLSNADSKIRIKVYIKSEDSSKRFLHTKAESYLKRELRKFSDVEIVDDSPDYVIRGMVGEIKRVGGPVEGYAATMVILRRHDLTQWGINLGFDVFTVIRQYIAVYDVALEDICRDFAVIVDAEALERHRWIKRSAKESAERFINELEKNDK